MSTDWQGSVRAIFDDCSDNVSRDDRGEARVDVKSILVAELLVKRSYCKMISTVIGVIEKMKNTYGRRL
jgi:hypothetical protein